MFNQRINKSKLITDRAIKPSHNTHNMKEAIEDYNKTMNIVNDLNKAISISKQATSMNEDSALHRVIEASHRTVERAKDVISRSDLRCFNVKETQDLARLMIVAEKYRMYIAELVDINPILPIDYNCPWDEPKALEKRTKEKINYSISEYYNEDEDGYIPEIGDADFDYNSWAEADPEGYNEWRAGL